MTNKFYKFFTLGALTLSTAIAFTSCGDDDEDKPEPIIDPVATKVFILNEGSWTDNNSTLDLYHPYAEPTTLQKDVFATINGEKIGDTGQDLIAYGNRLYLSVWGSNYLAKLDNNGKVIEKYQFKADEGQPRRLAADGKYVYVSTYGGKVAKFDTTSIAAPVAFVEVGNNPEGIAVKGNYLVVCNSQQTGADGKSVPDNRISIVDLSTFTLAKHITSDVYGNYQNVAVVKDSVYITYYTPSYSVEMLNLDINKGTLTPTGAATKMIGTYEGELFCANVATVYDENFNATTNTSFFVRDVTTGKDKTILDLSAAPELATATVYLFDIDYTSHDLYIGTTDYKTNGTIYHFDKDGKLLDKFETSSISPSKAVIF
ncbi:MAG: hypothetical protein IKP73_15135 [Bacteroidales bacterium]|nr:hypothetical protein [Bacteroidales bacterium]